MLEQRQRGRARLARQRNLPSHGYASSPGPYDVLTVLRRICHALAGCWIQLKAPAQGLRLHVLAPLRGAPGPTRPATSGRAARCRAAQSARRDRPPWWSASPHWLPACANRIATILSVTTLQFSGCPPICWHCPCAVVRIILSSALAEHHLTLVQERSSMPQVKGQRWVSKAR